MTLVGILTERTGAILLNTPGNPSGKVFTRRNWNNIVALSQRYDLLVFTDEIHEYFLYDQHEHFSIASLAGMGEQIITISGYSKTFIITGWRIGHSVAPAPYAGLMTPIPRSLLRGYLMGTVNY